jgi:hypothetical protein
MFEHKIEHDSAKVRFKRDLVRTSLLARIVRVLTEKEK